MHTVIDFRIHDEAERQEKGDLPFVVDHEMAALIRVNTRSWRQRNGLEHASDEAV